MSTRSSFLLAATAAMAAVLSVVCPTVASAKPAASTSPLTGIDVSYPQCGKSLPTGQAWAVVGVNGGLANDYNPCLNSQWAYASTLPGGAGQAPAQTYLNTGDPGNTVADWPNPSQMGAYGLRAVPDGSTCGYESGSAGRGANSTACAYVYGYDMVAGITYSGNQTILGDLAAFRAATQGRELSAQPVWLDVETANSWQSGAAGLAMNIATLQGMVDAIKDAAPSGITPTIGIYSTGYQWGQITGTPTGATAGNLAGLPVWIPGARTQSGAAANCSATRFRGGPVVMTQWFGRPYDGDVSCL